MQRDMSRNQDALTLAGHTLELYQQEVGKSEVMLGTPFGEFEPYSARAFKDLNECLDNICKNADDEYENARRDMVMRAMNFIREHGTDAEKAAILK